MPYKILENIAYADFALEVTAGSLPELFQEAARAIQAVQFEIKEIKPKVSRKVELNNYQDAQELLYDFLSEVIFYKDSESLAFGKFKIDLQIPKDGGVYNLRAQLWGEKIDPQKHTLHNDIKAITRYRFKLEEKKDKWRALIIVDV